MGRGFRCAQCFEWVFLSSILRIKTDILPSAFEMKHCLVSLTLEGAESTLGTLFESFVLLCLYSLPLALKRAFKPFFFLLEKWGIVFCRRPPESAKLDNNQENEAV